MQMQNVSTVSRLFIMFLSMFYLCSHYNMLTIHLYLYIMILLLFI